MTANGHNPSNKYFAIVPHIDDDDLDPFEMRLLVHIRRRAGADGACTESVMNMATITRMGDRKVRAVLKRLEKLKRITVQRFPMGTHSIRPVEIMAENIRRMESDRGCKNARLCTNAKPVKNARPCGSGRAGLAKTQDKEEPYKKIGRRSRPKPIRLPEPGGRRADGGGGREEVQEWDRPIGKGAALNSMTVPPAEDDE